MDSKPTAPQLPETLQYAMETLIRLATAEKYAIVGFMVRAEPASMAVIRNTKDDPAQYFRLAADIIEERASKGAVADMPVFPLN